MASANPYICFGGKCREAMTFYQECIGGDLQLMVYGDVMQGQCPEGEKDQIMHSSLTNGGLVLMATDMTGPQGLTVGNNMSVAIGCDTEEQIRGWFDKLSAGGTVVEPVKEQMWGALFGCLYDKYGICWMFNYYLPQAK